MGLRNRRLVQPELAVDAGERTRRMSADLMADHAERELLGNRLRARPAWTFPTLLNGYTPRGSGGPAFFKDASGIVHWKGATQNGSALNVNVLVVPAGFRVGNVARIPIDSGGAYGRIITNNVGDFRIEVGTLGADAYFDGVSWRAEA